MWTCRPPRLRPRRHAEHLAGLQIVRLRALARRRARAEENSTRPPPCHSNARGGAPCRDAGLQTSRPRRPLTHADTRGGPPRCGAGLKTSRPRRQSARKIYQNRPWASRTNNGLRTSNEETVRVGLKGCARDHTCASWCSRLPGGGTWLLSCSAQIRRGLLPGATALQPTPQVLTG